jgi:hypothetical protein
LSSPWKGAGHCQLVGEPPLFPRDSVCVQPSSQDCFGSQLVGSRCNACTHAAPMTGTDRGVSGKTTRASVADGAVETGGATPRGKARAVACGEEGPIRRARCTGLDAASLTTMPHPPFFYFRPPPNCLFSQPNQMERTLLTTIQTTSCSNVQLSKDPQPHKKQFESVTDQTSFSS